MGQRRTVRTAETPADAPEIAPKLRPVAGELGRGLVVEGDPTGSIGSVNCGGQGFEKLTPCLGRESGVVVLVNNYGRGHSRLLSLTRELPRSVRSLPAQKPRTACQLRPPSTRRPETKFQHLPSYFLASV